MDQPTATLLASIVAAGGSTLVGVGAVYFAWRQNVRTLSQQRQMAIEERLWERREELYVKLLSLTLYKGGAEEDTRLSDELQAIAPRVVAFASDEVQGTFNAILFASWMPFSDLDEAYERDERIGIQLDNLMSLMRWELQPDTKPSLRSGRPSSLKRRLQESSGLSVSSRDPAEMLKIRH